MSIKLNDSYIQHINCSYESCKISLFNKLFVYLCVSWMILFNQIYTYKSLSYTVININILIDIRLKLI